MKVIGLISTVVDWLVDKGVCAGEGRVCGADLRVKSATDGSAGVWKTPLVFAGAGTLG